MKRKMFFILRNADAGEGDNGGGGEGVTGGTVKVDNAIHGADSGATAPSFVDSIPEAFRDKPYLKDIDSMDKLLVNFDNAQKLIGSRPAAALSKDMPVEDLQKALEPLIPAAANEYTFPESEYRQKFGYDEAFQGDIQNLFHSAKLMPWQAEALSKGYDDLMLKTVSENNKSLEARDAEFDQRLKDTFGGKESEVLKTTNALLKENIPQELHEHVEKLSNEALFVMTHFAKNIQDKYISEDKSNIGGGTGQASSESLRAEAQKLLASEAYKDFRHPSHEATVQKVQDIYKQVARNT